MQYDAMNKELLQNCWMFQKMIVIDDCWCISLVDDSEGRIMDHQRVDTGVDDECNIS